MNEDIDKVKSKYETKVNDLKAAQKEPLETLEAYAKEQKATWKDKSMEMLHTIIGFRTNPRKVDKKKGFTWDAVLELMQKSKVAKAFIRTKEEINKEAILGCENEAMLNQLKEDCQIMVVQDEQFYVKVKTEEVAA